ncbi:DUF6115 domain-containing protein [Metabacillus sp. RGM 3146]|uniref:DUF6115 domain-containing protein n=1 Tax=Metabacillus sp. RGM 3146 TaxID=3401092 RepID=UPI003B9ACDDA
MQTVLVLISLMLHAAAFYFILLLFTRYSNVKNLEQEQRKLLEETEQVLTGYILEMKEENERLLKELTEGNNPHSTSGEEKRYAVEKEIPEIESDELPSHLEALADINDTIEISSSIPKKEKLLKDHVLELFNEGLTAEEIAKELGRGKTEIELILKFRQK